MRERESHWADALNYIIKYDFFLLLESRNVPLRNKLIYTQYPIPL